MSYSKIVYPPPPPTTNSLTAKQRAQLLRTTQKLGRILGTTPYVTDDSSVLDLAYHDAPRISRTSLSGTSTDSFASGSRSSSRSSASLRRSSSISSSASSARSAKSVAASAELQKETWANTRPPVLRLSISQQSPSSLESIPGSPRSESYTSSGPSSSSASASRRSSLDSSERSETDRRFTLQARSDDPHTPSMTLPSFSIPSSSSLRRDKMDRLRRKLGDGVPIQLVFPKDDGQSGNRFVVTQFQTSEKDLPRIPSNNVLEFTPTPRVQQRPRADRGITSARDSIIDTTSSPHRAQRVKRKPVPTLVASRPAPPPPVPSNIPCSNDIPSNIPSNIVLSGKKNARLSLIMESPDEHGVPCVQIVGQLGGRWGTDSAQISEEEFTSGRGVNVWSIGKGYEGWLDYTSASQLVN